MAYLDKLNAIARFVRALQRTEHTVDAITGVAINSADTPGFQALNEKITGHFCHCVAPWLKKLIER